MSVCVCVYDVYLFTHAVCKYSMRPSGSADVFALPGFTAQSTKHMRKTMPEHNTAVHGTGVWEPEHCYLDIAHFIVCFVTKGSCHEATHMISLA